MQKSFRIFLFSLLTAFLAVSCASYTEKMREVQLLYRTGQYDLALKKLQESDLREDKRSKLLFHLEKGSIHDRMGDASSARKEFMIADRIADDLYTTRLRNEAASLFVNDSFTDYAGEDYEKVAIHTLLALSFIGDRKMKPALVEARKINTKLNAINTEYDDDAKNTYSEDAFARLLAGAIHESQGNWDSAIVDYQLAYKVYTSTYKKDFYTVVPDALVLGLLRLYKKRGRTKKYNDLLEDFSDLKSRHNKAENGKFAEVLVIHELGHITRKTRNEMVFNWGQQIVRMSWPKIVYRRGYYGRTGVEVIGDTFYGSEKAQDFNAIAAKTLDERGGRIFLKNAVRIAAKGQVNKQARRQFGELGGLVANIFNVATETADTRSWTGLPAEIKVTRVLVPVGKSQLKIKSDGELQKVATVNLKKGQLRLIRAIEPD